MDYVDQNQVESRDVIDQMTKDKPCSFDMMTLKSLLEEDGVPEITTENLLSKITQQERLFTEQFKKRKQQRI